MFTNLVLLGQSVHRLANVGILGKEGEPGVGKLGWHGKFDIHFIFDIQI